MTSEHELRLQDILQGPWHEQSRLAREVAPRLSDAEAERAFRSHYREGIYEKAEINFRESFDQALEELQLLELAVASGYLPLETVRAVAQPEFETLLRSNAARAYLQLYDFVPVRFLAARLDIDLGLAPVQPPEIDPEAAVRYATFLAVHSDFTASAPIGHFTMLMDDYRFHGNIDATSFRLYLAGTAQATDEQKDALDELRLGLVQFVQTLGDLFLQLRDEEKALYGCVYGYWLSHFFGVRRTGVGYVRDGVSFEDVSRSRLLVPAGLEEEAAQAEQQRLAGRTAVLRDVWDRTRALIESLERRRTDP